MIIYHNPRCSKSRQTLELLEENGISPEVVLYLNKPLSAQDIKSLISKLGITPRDLLRKGEAEYKSLGLADKNHSDSALIDAMAAHPKLIERPIVVHKEQAILGRPPENVLKLI